MDFSNDVTLAVGEVLNDEEVLQLRNRVDALGWQMRAEQAGPGQQRIVAISAPAVADGDNEEFSPLLIGGAA